MAISPISFLHCLLFFLLTLSTQSSSSDHPQTFIIHVTKSHKPSLFSSHHDWYTSIIRSLPPSPHPAKLLYNYNHAIHGFSAHLTATQVEKLRRVPGILSVIPDQVRQLHTTHTPAFLGLSESSGLWQNSGYGDVLGNGWVFNGVSLYSGDPLVDLKLPLVYAGDVGNRFCYVGSISPSKVQGKIVVCDRGGNARVEKGAAVKLAGGLGMILANTADSGEELIADSHLLPATEVGEIAANKIREYVKLSQYPTATINFRGTIIGTSPAAPKVAAFSSRGPNYLTPEILKPDVIAPGVNILAGWTGFVGPTDLEIDPRRVEFNIISGTSMSCPHVSGIVALLRKAYPDWSPAAIKSALVTTAHNLDNSGKNIKDLASGEESTPFIHGAGHVDPNSALNPGLVYDMDTSDYIAFLCAIGYDSKRIAVFVREPPRSDICSGKEGSPGNLNYPSFSVVFQSSSDVVTYRRTVKNVGNSLDAVYEVKVNAPANVEINVSPSRLVFSAENKTMSYEITFSSASLGWSSIHSAAFGSIEWSNGIHGVRSPIAVKWRQGSSMESI
ncbi:PROPROTEIN CONVERTASE SUBTILISIN/KEXIN [Salix purpurea]|uniref:PROPROTEIN CONVERTASE SUBTILISIN/KEXIN n=1 Tax=Salix purpurea TaxID=77065 RepID=A0A9Q0QGH7_SALPP|nr:PROPROTEIN CONVERTASE SUBTILISIN/KEXIN [Salix purpurea]